MNTDQALPTFFAESEELLEQMEESLLQIEHEGASAEPINAIFRAVHTIKGSAGLFGFDAVVGFTHVLESVLDRVRNGELALQAKLSALLLDGHDHISKLIALAVDGQKEADTSLRQRGEILLKSLEGYLGSDNHTPPSVARQCPAYDAQDHGDGHWHISLRFGQEVLRNGMDPLSFLRYLTTLGEIVHLTTLYTALPESAEMDPEACYLGFEIGFASAAHQQEIENVFEFVREDCRIRILPPRSRADDYIRFIQELSEDSLRIGDLLVLCGAISRDQLNKALATQAQSSGLDPRPIGAILAEQNGVEPQVIDAAVEKQKQVREVKNQDARFIRVEADKLEHLINLVGELVIAAAGTGLMAGRIGHADLSEATSTLSRLVEEVRDSSLNLRMVQIGATFNRFHRIVRDVSKEIGKDIELIVNGAETELDKTVVEKIGDPLTHLVRNAIDHGIEPPSLRQERGKAQKGTIKLNAHHDSGSIVIEVADDGGGLDRDKLVRKAISRGLISPEQSLSEQEAYALIFEPGFSTAEQVTNLSGRGVGMDVVRRNITALRGTVEIDSRYGFGTTIRIRLPLTLAIIDGFLVGVGRNSYVIPLDMVVECIELSAREQDTERSYLDLRGQVLPYVRLAKLFEIDNDAPAQRESIVVVHAGALKAGLVVNQLLGEVQTVIKPLGTLFNSLRGISGSAILGSGEVALILDVPALLTLVSNQAHHSHSSQLTQATV